MSIVITEGDTTYTNHQSFNLKLEKPISVSDFLSNLEKIRTTGAVYLYGAKGEVITDSLVNRLAKENPKTYTNIYKKKALPLYGLRGVDCSGLITLASGAPVEGSYYMGQNYKPAPTLQRGVILWRKGHVGVYIGNDKVIEAKGIDFGIVISKYKKENWAKMLLSPYVDYSSTQFYYKKGWNKDDKGWWYAWGTNKGEFYANTIEKLEWLGGTNLFAFNAEGYMIEGLAVLKIDGQGCIKSVLGTS